MYKKKKTDNNKRLKLNYHIAINEVDRSEFGITPAKNTRISKDQHSKLKKYK